MLLLTNTVSGRRLFHKQPPEFCIECHTATILAGRTEFIGRVSSNTIRRDSLGLGVRAQSQASRAAGASRVDGGCAAGGVVEVQAAGDCNRQTPSTISRLKHLS